MSESKSPPRYSASSTALNNALHLLLPTLLPWAAHAPSGTISDLVSSLYTQKQAAESAVLSHLNRSNANLSDTWSVAVSLLQLVQEEDTEFFRQYQMLPQNIKPACTSCGTRISAWRDSLVVFNAPMASDAAILNQIALRKKCPTCKVDLDATIHVPNYLIVFAPPGVDATYVTQALVRPVGTYHLITILVGDTVFSAQGNAWTEAGSGKSFSGSGKDFPATLSPSNLRRIGLYKVTRQTTASSSGVHASTLSQNQARASIHPHAGASRPATGTPGSNSTAPAVPKAPTAAVPSIRNAEIQPLKDSEPQLAAELKAQQLKSNELQRLKDLETEKVKELEAQRKQDGAALHQKDLEIQRLKASLKRISDSISCSDAEKMQQQQKLAESTSTVAQLREKVATLSTQNQHLQVEVARYVTQLKVTEDARVSLLSQVTAESQNRTAATATWQQTIRSLEAQISALTSENTSLKSQLQARNTELQQLVAEKKAAQSQAEQTINEITELRRQSSVRAASGDWGVNKANAIRKQLEDSGVEKDMAEHEFMGLYHYHTKASEIAKHLRGDSIDKTGSQVAIMLDELQQQLATVRISISSQPVLLTRYPVLKSTLSVATEDVKNLLQDLEKAKFSDKKASKQIKRLCEGIQKNLPQVNIAGSVVLEWGGTFELHQQAQVKETQTGSIFANGTVGGGQTVTGMDWSNQVVFTTATPPTAPRSWEAKSPKPRGDDNRNT